MIFPRKLILVGLVINILNYGSECYSQCVEKNESFLAGEELKYQIAYNWGFIWVNAGEAVFSVKNAQLDGQEVFHFIAKGNSYEKWDWIYKVRDTYESYVDKQSLKPLLFKRDVLEGSYRVNNQYKFDYIEQSIAGELDNSESGKRNLSIPLKSCTMDVLTMIYQARNIDFAEYKKEDKIPIRMIVEGEIHDLYIRYLGEEILKTRDKRKFNCYKFKPLLIDGTIFTGGENMTVWVSRDKNRIPIMVEAKILVGSVKAYLVESINTRYSLQKFED